MEEIRKHKVHSLIDKVYYRLNLTNAWEMVRKNQGAAGVDWESIKKFEEKLEENIERIHQNLKGDTYEPQPVRRVWIPKPDGRKRPLGIPTVRDRIVQQALRLRLEPIFDPYFSESSYGFRKGRSARQALGDIMYGLTEGKNWVLEVDIQGYFDTIDHERLIDLVAERVADGRVLRLIRKMLKAGVMEDFRCRKETTGTPQGGVISPLLANIFLDYYDQKMSQKGFRVIRYADDFVIICEKKSHALTALEYTKKILEGEMGLELHPAKTKIVHVTQGFEFLGHFIKQGRSLYMIPREKAIKAFKDRVRSITKRSRPMRLTEMVKELNRVVVGWGNYFRWGNVKRLFWRLDCWVRRRVKAFKAKRWCVRYLDKYTSGFIHNCLGLKSLYRIKLLATCNSLRGK